MIHPLGTRTPPFKNQRTGLSRATVLLYNPNITKAKACSHLLDAADVVSSCALAVFFSADFCFSLLAFSLVSVSEVGLSIELWWITRSEQTVYTDHDMQLTGVLQTLYCHWINTHVPSMSCHDKGCLWFGYHRKRMHSTWLWCNQYYRKKNISLFPVRTHKLHESRIWNHILCLALAWAELATKLRECLASLGKVQTLYTNYFICGFTFSTSYSPLLSLTNLVQSFILRASLVKHN